MNDHTEIFCTLGRPVGGRLRRFLSRLLSAFLHVFALAILFIAAETSGLNMDPEAGWKVNYVFVAPADKQATERAATAFGGIGEQPPAGAGRPEVELKGMKLAISKDPEYRMVEAALHRYRGMIGLALTTEPDFVTSAFRAPDWRFEREGLLSIESFFVMKVEQPDQWELLRKLRARHEVDGSYLVYALFPPKFIPQLHAAIRETAGSKSQRGKVTDVRIEFVSNQPAGFRVLDVVVVAENDHRDLASNISR